MRQPVAPDGVGQRLHHRFLTDQLAERLRTIFAREHAVGLRRVGDGRRRGRRRSFGGLRRAGFGLGWLASEHRTLTRSLQFGGGRRFGFAIGQIGIRHEGPI